MTTTFRPLGAEVHVQANGINHRILKYGSHGPSVVIVPGITSTALTAEFIALPLSVSYTVYVLDLRGRGGTDVPPSGSYHLADYVADVAGILDSLGLQRVTLIGHSLGARIAAGYVSSDYAQQIIADAVLIDPPLTGPGRGAYPTPRNSFIKQLKQSREGTSVDAVRTFYPMWPERELAIRIQELPSCDETAVLETYDLFHQEDFHTLWEQLPSTSFLIHGADSPVVTSAGLVELHKRNPSIPIVGVPRAGHMVPWDNYPEFTVTLSRYLRTIH